MTKWKKMAKLKQLTLEHQLWFCISSWYVQCTQPVTASLPPSYFAMVKPWIRMGLSLCGLGSREAYFLLQIRAEPHPHSWLQVVFIYVLEGRVLHWFDLLGGDGAGIVGGKGPVIRVDNLVNVRVVFPRFQPILGTHTILYACQSNGKI